MHDLGRYVQYKNFEKAFYIGALGHHKVVLLATLVIFVLSLLSLPLIKQEFFPSSTRNENRSIHAIPAKLVHRVHR